MVYGDLGEGHTLVMGCGGTVEGRRAAHGVWRPWAKAGDMLVTGYGGLRKYTLVMGCGGPAGRGGAGWSWSADGQGQAA